jgi:glutamine amidotransferase
MVTIVDYGMGNLGSVRNMFNYIKVPVQVSGDAKVIEQAVRVLLPGVGAFDAAMLKINDAGLRDVLQYKAMEEKVPVLGICLGMQLLTNGSEEGMMPGFGWIDATTQRFRFADKNMKVPHMGWNLTREIQPSALTKDLGEEPRFYFVHSYYITAADEKNVLMRTHYGHDFDSVITNGGNIYGAQFHPEKSHKFGMQLFKNFAKL